MTDVLIAGGGIAGSVLAILLGRQGLQVELLEKRTFPREKPCGEGLMPAGVAVLERLGLLGQVGGVRFHGVRYRLGPHSIEGRFPLVEGFPRYGLAQRRYRLDQALFQAAAATTGVQAASGVAVEQLLRECGRVTGVVANGEARRAKLVVGADGAQSRVRALLGWNVPSPRKRIGARVHFRLAPSRRQMPWVNVILLDQAELYVTPLPDHEVGVAALAAGGALEAPLEQAFGVWRRASPFLADYLDGAEQSTDLLATSPLGQRALQSAAPGVVLLGDAAGSTDPITGGGMAQALLCATLLAHFLGREPAADPAWLPAFEHDRRALLRDYQRLTGLMLSLSRHPGLAHLALRGLGRLPGTMSHLIGVAGGLRTLLGGRAVPARLLP
jgi:2-polyprenyl-6-methoxyphenol hydroxylase-like FAD-dependent oxidoreductase